MPSDGVGRGNLDLDAKPEYWLSRMGSRRVVFLYGVDFEARGDDISVNIRKIDASSSLATAGGNR